MENSEHSGYQLRRKTGVAAEGLLPLLFVAHLMFVPQLFCSPRESFAPEETLVEGSCGRMKPSDNLLTAQIGGKNLPGVVTGSAITPQPPSVTVPQAVSKPGSWRAEGGGFFSALDRGYGNWRGIDLKLQYASKRYTPFLLVSSQSRDEGSQRNFLAGSYIIFNDRFYSIVDVSSAPGGSAVLYPRLRVNVLGLMNVRAIQGLVATAGVSEIRFPGRAGGRVFSVGSLYYRDKAILDGNVFFNRDRASGDTSTSFSLGGQYGREGSSWTGAHLFRGKEAYQNLSATPFDVRFDSFGVSLFLQKWLRARQGVTAKYEFENKFDAYRRHGVAVSWFVGF